MNSSSLLSLDEIYRRLNLSLEAIAQCCEKWQLVESSLFGSVLHDDFCVSGDRPSDIDLLYVSAPEARYGFNCFDMQAELEQLFNRERDQDAIILCLIVIGEATKQLSTDFRLALYCPMFVALGPLLGFDIDQAAKSLNESPERDRTPSRFRQEVAQTELFPDSFTVNPIQPRPSTAATTVQDPTWADFGGSGHKHLKTADTDPAGQLPAIR